MVLQDTPIYNEKCFDEISAIFPESDGDGNRNLNNRVKSTELFINYLLEQENLDLSRKEQNYGIKCLDRQIIKSLKENGLKLDLQRLENALTRQTQNIA